MNNSILHYSILEAPLIKRESVKGDEKCNYEKYLVEVINATTTFSTRFNEPFQLIEQQNCGQCDARSGIYNLDFKLIASQSMLRAKGIFSFQITKVINGIYAYSPSKNKGEIEATRFPQAFRGMTIDEILTMCKQATKRKVLESDVKKYMETLETKKNLLLFFPFRFYYEHKGEIVDDIMTVIKECEKDFGITLNYRTQIYPLLDTFFVFLYENYFVLCQWIDGQLIHLETIQIDKSKTFMYLSQTYCKGWCALAEVGTERGHSDRNLG